MGYWDINFTSLVRTIVPVRLRQANMLAWLGVLVSPVVWVYDLFVPNRKANLYNLAHDGQVCYLQAALNDTFDSVLRRIYITDGVYKNPIFLYKNIELKPVFIDKVSEIGTGVIAAPDPLPLFTDTEAVAYVVSFTVNVPVALVFDLAYMKSLIGAYKLPGKQYTIVTF